MTEKEKYSLTKEMLYQKFDGRCAFCGHELGVRWCIWAIKPQKSMITFRGELIIGDDSYENKLPACISCNSTRSHATGIKSGVLESPKNPVPISIEEFRKWLLIEFEFLKSGSMAKTYYNKALKFGLIKETGNDIVFYFEKHK